MEIKTDRFFKGFSLEGYKLQVLINALEREKKQRLNRLREETHIFKMSIKAPVKCGEECWSQYGEIFHANGDKRDTSSITRINLDQYKEEKLNSDTTIQDSRTSTDKKSSSPVIKLPPESLELCQRGNQTPQVSYLQRNRDKSSTKGRNDPKKSAKPHSLSLLELFCAEFENGTIVGKRTLAKSCPGSKISAVSLGQGGSRQGHMTEQDDEEPSLVSDNERRMSKGTVDSNGKSRSSRSSRKKSKLQDLWKSDNSTSRSNSISFEVLDSDCSLPQKIPVGECNFSCQEISSYDRTTKSRSVTSKDSKDENDQLREIRRDLPKGRQMNERTSGLLASSDCACPNEIERCGNASSENATPESQTSEERKAVHFMEGGKPSRRKNKVKKCFDRGEDTGKAKRTRTRLFRLDDLQSYERGKSQEEIDTQTREKMDNFFAKLERTKCFQRGEQRSRPFRGTDCNPRVKGESKNTLEQEKRIYAFKKEHGYRRARPWPIQVWS